MRVCFHLPEYKTHSLLKNARGQYESRWTGVVKKTHHFGLSCTSVHKATGLEAIGHGVGTGFPCR